MRQTYFDYFTSGLSPADAIRCHENNFLYEENFIGLANSAIKVQVYYLYRIWKQLNYESAPPLEMLKQKLELYQSNGMFKKYIQYNILINHINFVTFYRL